MAMHEPDPQSEPCSERDAKPCQMRPLAPRPCARPHVAWLFSHLCTRRDCACHTHCIQDTTVLYYVLVVCNTTTRPRCHTTHTSFLPRRTYVQQHLHSSLHAIPPRRRPSVASCHLSIPLRGPLPGSARAREISLADARTRLKHACSCPSSPKCPNARAGWRLGAARSHPPTRHVTSLARRVHFSARASSRSASSPQRRRASPPLGP